MARYTIAYSAYVRRVAEVGLLTGRAAALEREDAVGNTAQINALCRGGVVLLSSHVEAYVKELGEILITAFTSNAIDRQDIDRRVFYHISKTHFDSIRDAADPAKVASAMFEFLATQQDYWNGNGPFTQQIDASSFNRGFSNPSFKKIRTYFNRFGFEEYSGQLKAKLRSQYLPYTNMVNHLVEVRNKIAHGDLSATKTPREVDEMTTILRGFCQATDSVYGDWCKQKYCSIR